MTRWSPRNRTKNARPIGKPWENHGKTMGKPWENGDFTEKTG